MSTATVIKKVDGITVEKVRGRTHLVLPDLHAHPDFDNERFTAIGNLIVDLKPDVVICLGDFGDFPSLCSYDKGTKSFEGRRYKKDLACFKDAMSKLMAPIRAAKKKKPEFHFCYGNHEARINRVTELEPTLDGVVSLRDLELEKNGWITHDFLTPVSIDGVLYCHYFVSGVLNRPVSGINIANTLIAKGHTSATMGHTHTRAFAESIGFDGRSCIGVVAGACIDFPQEWTSAQVDQLWWSGVLIKRNVNNGKYDLEWMGIDSLMDNYNPEAVERRGYRQEKGTKHDDKTNIKPQPKLKAY